MQVISVNFLLSMQVISVDFLLSMQVISVNFLLSMQVIRSKSKDCLSRNWNNMSEWSNISTRGLFLQLASSIKSFIGLVQSRLHHHLIECILYKPWYGWKNCLFGVKQQSLTHSNLHFLFSGFKIKVAIS